MTVTQTGRTEVDRRLLLNTLSTLVVSEIVLRTGRGLDIYGRPFRPYSASYTAKRLEAGRKIAPVTLRLTGGLLGGVAERQRVLTSTQATIFVGPDSGQSRRVRMNSRGVQTTGGAGPQHTQIGEWLHYGRGRLPARPWLGLTRQQVAKIRRVLERTRGALKPGRRR